MGKEQEKKAVRTYDVLQVVTTPELADRIRRDAEEQDRSISKIMARILGAHYERRGSARRRAA